MSPWYISARAIREWAAFRGVRDLPSIGPEWDRFREELAKVAQDAIARKSPKRTSSGLLVYHIRKPLDVKLIVSDAPRPEGPLPALINIQPGYGAPKTVPCKEEPEPTTILQLHFRIAQLRAALKGVTESSGLDAARALAASALQIDGIVDKEQNHDVPAHNAQTRSNGRPCGRRAALRPPRD